MTTSEYLAQFGVSIQQAHDFVFANLDAPDHILAVAAQYGVTRVMLGEIAGGYSVTDVQTYFASHGLDASSLDGAGVTFGYDLSAPAGPLAIVGIAPDYAAA
jgi:hypothetical protein